MRVTARTWLSAAAALGVAVFGITFAVISIGAGAGDTSIANQDTVGTDPNRLSDPPKPAFEIPTPVALKTSGFESTWAPLRRSVTARTGPGESFGRVARIASRTPEGTTNLVLVLGDGGDRNGGDGLWLHVRLPVLPNNTTGWVPRSALGGYGLVRTHLVVDLGDRRATLRRNGKVVFGAPVGIGTTEYPTPKGRFYVRNKLTRYRNAFYGPIAFGTSARSAALTDWPAGGFVGIHGTSRPELIPGSVSHGCIRLRNKAILRLAALMPIGTPLTIRA
jgi:hypothetical protein